MKTLFMLVESHQESAFFLSVNSAINSPSEMTSPYHPHSIGSDFSDPESRIMTCGGMVR